MRDRRRVTGLTLVEVLVATVLTGVSVLGALGILSQAQAVAGQVQRTTTASRRAHASIALLRAFALQLTVARDTATSFVGSELSARFETRCRVPRGWVEPCIVSLSVEDSAGVDHLHLDTNGFGRWEVIADSSILQLRYLEDASDGGHWRPTWTQTHSIPLGLGLIRFRDGATDTLFLRIGRRG
jgi:hypothetical protein